ncbi:FAS1 [Geosmithia morbida]|uniref:FAS1 n=1 Tax=Geosmithia morbida TaxID=1094350 RepID=A0A9P5D663_9HYPO|nr:FAS1 [Geosmithia morbida]KAF4124460.1 FAS1 [Geosmithia morbida]
MLVAKLLVAIAGLASVASAQEKVEDLGSTLAGIRDLSTFYNLIKKYPDVLLQLPSYGGVTIIAPSNEAFKNIPYTALNQVWDPDNKTTTVPLLQYHIVQGTVATGALEAGPSVIESTLLDDPRYTNVTSGQKVVINKSGDGTVVLTTSMGTRCTVQESDIAFTGGLIQIVDNLLVPPAQLGATSDAFKVPNFLGSLYAAGLMPGVALRRNLTVFAPVDRALDQIGGSLLDLDGDDLGRVMAYHLVHDQVIVSSDLTNGSHLPTLAGDDLSLTVRVAGNDRYVNSAQIVQPDILIANGIMHLISNVLNPDSAVLPDPQANSQPALFPISSVANPFTSDLPCTVSCPVTTTSSTRPTSTAGTTATRITTDTNTALAARVTGHLAGVAVGALGLGLGLGAEIAWL